MEQLESKQCVQPEVSIPFVGPVLNAFKANRIPTKREALQVMFYYNYLKHHTIPESIQKVAKIVVQLTIIGYTAKRVDSVQKCLQRLYEQWRDTQRSKSKTSPAAEAKRKLFEKVSPDCYLVLYH